MTFKVHKETQSTFIITTKQKAREKSLSSQNIVQNQSIFILFELLVMHCETYSIKGPYK